MSLRIVHYNEPVFRVKGEKVAKFDGALARLVAEMIDEHAGNGGAAVVASHEHLGLNVRHRFIELGARP